MNDNVESQLGAEADKLVNSSRSDPWPDRRIGLCFANSGNPVELLTNSAARFPVLAKNRNLRSVVSRCPVDQ